MELEKNKEKGGEKGKEKRGLEESKRGVVRRRGTIQTPFRCV